MSEKHLWSYDENYECTKLTLEYFVMEKRDFNIWFKPLIKKLYEKFDKKISENSIKMKIQNIKALLDEFNIENTLEIGPLSCYSIANKEMFIYFLLKWDLIKCKKDNEFKDIVNFEFYEPFWDDIVFEVIKNGKINYHVIEKFCDDVNKERMIWDCFIYFKYVDYLDGSKCLISKEDFDNIIKNRETNNKKIVTYKEVKDGLYDAIYDRIVQLNFLDFNDNSLDYLTKDNIIKCLLDRFEDFDWHKNNNINHFCVDNFNIFLKQSTTHKFYCKIYKRDFLNDIPKQKFNNILAVGSIKNFDDGEFFERLYNMGVNLIALGENAFQKFNYEFAIICSN